MSCDVTERDLPALSQTSRGQRVKRERLGTRLMERVIRVVIITVLRLETKEFNFLLSLKHDSRPHSTPCFHENVVVAETSFVSCQMLGDFISLRSGEGLTSFNETNRANFSGKKNRNEAFRGVDFLRIREKV